MLVVVIDRLRQRVLTTLRIFFLLALMALLAGQFLGLFQAGQASAPGGGRATGQVRPSPAESFAGNLARDLRNFYLGPR